MTIVRAGIRNAVSKGFSVAGEHNVEVVKAVLSWMLGLSTGVHVNRKFSCSGKLSCHRSKTRLQAVPDADEKGNIVGTEDDLHCVMG